MKSYQERKMMFMDWSDGDLREALDIICKRFGLKLIGQHIVPIVDFEEVSAPQHLWTLQAYLSQPLHNYYDFIESYDKENNLLPIRAYCQHKRCGFDYECTYHEAMRSMLAMFASSTLTVAHVYTGENECDNKEIGIVPDFSSLEELKLKLAVV